MDSNEWKLVPVEPTAEMLNAKTADLLRLFYSPDAAAATRVLADIYKFMLAAAPQPPALGGEPEVLGYWCVPKDAPLQGCFHENKRLPLNWPTDHYREVFNVTAVVDRAHVARLQAEVERLNALHDVDTEAMRRMLARNAELEGLLEEALSSVRVDAGKCDSAQEHAALRDLESRIVSVLAGGKEHE